jgi:hypothetical protein
MLLFAITLHLIPHACMLVGWTSIEFEDHVCSVQRVQLLLPLHSMWSGNAKMHRLEALAQERAVLAPQGV